jgi:hypothetical protein
VQHQNAPEDTFAAERLAESAPRRAQIPVASHIDADAEAIRELRERIKDLWGNPAAPTREDLGARLDLLGRAVDHRATDSRPVREAQIIHNSLQNRSSTSHCYEQEVQPTLSPGKPGTRQSRIHAA